MFGKSEKRQPAPEDQKNILENEGKWIRPDFRKPQLDLVWNRDYSLNGERFSVNTLTGRLKLTFHKDGMEKYFDSAMYRFGTAKLVYRHGKFYLHIPVSTIMFYPELFTALEKAVLLSRDKVFTMSIKCIFRSSGALIPLQTA